MSIAPADPREPITAEMWGQLRARWPDGERLAVAWRLARDVDTLHDLLAGLAVSPERLDQGELEAARLKRLVTLSRAVDLVRVDDG